MLKIQKAQKRAKKLRCIISGQTGAGKTFSAILLAMGLTNRGRVLIFDTENKRASLKQGNPTLEGFDFDVIEADPESLGRPVQNEDFIEAIELAEKNNYDCLIIDSATQQWDAIKDLHARLPDKNSFMAWGKAKKEHQKFVNKFLYSRVHIILTVRSDMKYEQQEVNGRKEVIKLGLGSQQESNLLYYADFSFDIQKRETHEAIPEKYEGGIFDREPTLVVTEKIGKRIVEWLNAGVDPAKEKKQEFINRIMELTSSLIEQGKDVEKLSEEDLDRLSFAELTSLGKKLKSELVSVVPPEPITEET